MASSLKLIQSSDNILFKFSLAMRRALKGLARCLALVLRYYKKQSIALVSHCPSLAMFDKLIKELQMEKNFLVKTVERKQKIE